MNRQSHSLVFRQRVFQAACAIWACLALSACQNTFEPLPLSLPVHLNPELTGGRTEDGRLQTSASDDLSLQELKSRIDGNSPENLALAQSITSARVVRRGQMTSGGLERIDIEVQLKALTSKLEFSTGLTLGRTTLGFAAVPAKANPEYTLSGTCGDAECRKLTLRLAHTARTSDEKKAEAGMILRDRNLDLKTHLAARAPVEGQTSTRLEPIHRAIETGASARLETLEIAWGLSQFALRVDLSNAPLCISGRLVETNESDETLKTKCTDDQGPDVLRGVLVGNNNRGGLVMNLVEGPVVLVVTALIREGDNEPSSPAPQTEAEDTGLADVDGPSAGTLEPTPNNRPSTDSPTANSSPSAPIVTEGTWRLPVDASHPVTRHWEKDRGRAETQKAARVWSTTLGERTRQFLSRIQPHLPILTNALSQSRVPNEILTITMMESRYFVDPGFPVEVHAKSSATGPWQFLSDTAKWLGLKIRPFTPGRQAHPCDERAQLGPSTSAAGRYFRFLLDEFPHDPRLAVMSYYWGQGNVANGVNCMKSEECIKRNLRSAPPSRVAEIKNSGFDFWSVREFNMAPRDATDYVIRFVAGQFVLRAPESYGLNPLQLRDSDVLPPSMAACK